MFRSATYCTSGGEATRVTIASQSWHLQAAEVTYLKEGPSSSDMTLLFLD